MSTADIDGSGKVVVINAALTGAAAGAPDYRDQTPLVYYVPGEWKRRVISTENSGVVHGIFVTDWDGNGRQDILTASFTGIHLFRYTKDARWTRTEIAKGDPAPWPKSGSSDIAVGHIAKSRFLAAIEPWHGSQVAVYTQNGAQWNREVIDTTLNDGHTSKQRAREELKRLTAAFEQNGGTITRGRSLRAYVVCNICSARRMVAGDRRLARSRLPQIRHNPA